MDQVRLEEADLARLGTDIQRRIGVKTSRHEPLARFTTMRVGGPADLFAEVHNLFELRAIVRFARSRELPHFIIGRGSDLVISDAGMRGLVIYNRAQQHRFEADRLICDSGLPMARAATLCKTEGLSGLEFGLAIPGTIGGAVWANAGAHEADIRNVLAEASVMRGDGSEETLDRDGLGLAYRESHLKHSPPGRPEALAKCESYMPSWPALAFISATKAASDPLTIRATTLQIRLLEATSISSSILSARIVSTP